MTKHNRRKLVGIFLATSLLFSGCGRPQDFSEFLDTEEGQQLVQFIVKVGGCEVISYGRYYNPSKSAKDNLTAIQQYVAPCVQQH